MDDILLKDYFKIRTSEQNLDFVNIPLSDCELMIDGIGADKISDITTNIIRGKLIEYTERQCLEMSIPVKSVESNFYWSIEDGTWIKREAMLPFYEGKPILFVPKNIVVKQTVSNYEKFYDISIIPYLQDLHISMNTHLVKVLKNGKRIVTKKSLESEFKCTKENVRATIEAHPELLEKYKATRF